ncbi:MAG: DUF424 family protein [Candidatus Nanoarchaeia archaeon]
MYLKKHSNGEHIIIGICDSDLIGQVFRENGLKLDISESFYKGQEVTKEEATHALEEGSNLNLAGKETIQLAIDLGLATQDEIKTIDGIPYLLIFAL